MKNYLRRKLRLPTVINAMRNFIPLLPESKIFLRRLKSSEILNPYLDSLKQDFPNFSVNGEHRLILRWFHEHEPTVEPSEAVRHAMNVANRAYRYVELFKKEHPSLALNMLRMNIFWLLDDHYSDRRVDFALSLGNIAYKNMQGLSEEQKKNRTLIKYYLFFAENYPKFSPEEIPVRIEDVQKRIQPYVECVKDSHFFGINRLSPERIRVYLWLADEYPALEIGKAVKWAKEISSTNSYRRTSQHFPPTYPFYYLEFQTFTNGLAKFRLVSKTFLGVPNFDFLKAAFSAQNEYSGVCINFDLNDSKGRERLLPQLQDIIERMELHLKPKDADSTLFNEYKQQLFSAARESICHFQAGFTGLKWVQFSPPKDYKEEQSELGREIWNAIEKYDYECLKINLKKGLNPNLLLHHLSLLKTAIKTVWDYRVFMRGGEPDEEQLKKNVLRYDLILSKYAGVYILYWRGEKNEICRTTIENHSDLQFLSSLESHYFTSEGRLKSSSQTEKIEALAEMVWRATKGNLEEVRRKEAGSIISIIELLMEYGADPSERPADPYACPSTALEYLLACASFRKSDLVNRELLKELLRFFLPADQGRSHLSIATEFYNHFLGRFILAGLAALNRKHNSFLPAFLKVSRSPGKNLDSNIGMNFFVENRPKVELKTIMMSELQSTQLDEMYELFKHNFPWQKKIKLEELNAYFIALINSHSGPTFVDLIFIEGKIEAFNIATFIQPEIIEKKRVFLHYAILTVRSKMLEPYQKLMWIVFAKRGFALKEQCPDENVEVYTVYDAATLQGYLAVANLCFYPKFTCINDEVLQFIHRTIFNENAPPNSPGMVWYVPEKLSDKQKPRRKDLLPNFRFFNTRTYENISQEKRSIVIIFKNDLSNLARIAMEINPYLANALFEEIIKMVPEESSVFSKH